MNTSFLNSLLTESQNMIKSKISLFIGRVFRADKYKNSVCFGLANIVNKSVNFFPIIARFSGHNFKEAWYVV